MAQSVYNVLKGVKCIWIVCGLPVGVQPNQTRWVIVECLAIIRECMSLTARSPREYRLDAFWHSIISPILSGFVVGLLTPGRMQTFRQHLVGGRDHTSSWKPLLLEHPSSGLPCWWCSTIFKVNKLRVQAWGQPKFTNSCHTLGLLSCASLHSGKPCTRVIPCQYNDRKQRSSLDRTYLRDKVRCIIFVVLHNAQQVHPAVLFPQVPD